MRQFIRHPVNVPIMTEYRNALPAFCETSNVGAGGLTFSSGRPFRPGTLLHVQIPCVSPPFESDARVVWCHAQEHGFELGIEFLSVEDAFRARMVEQICHIQAYRQEVDRLEGRKLTAMEAAEEWIRKYASGFPNPDDQ